MIPILSYIVLWVLVILVSFSTLTLLKRKPIIPGLPLQDKGLTKGTRIPLLKLQSITGGEINLIQQDKLGTLLIFVSANCHGCLEVYPALDPFVNRHPDISINLAISGDDNEILEKIEKYNIRVPVIKPNSKELEDLKISLFPFAYFLAPNGSVLAKGGVAGGLQHLELLIREASVIKRGVA